MILIYGKGKVGNALVDFCQWMQLPYDCRDDSDSVDFEKYDIIIPSPGIPSSHSVYKTGKVKSELDFIYPFVPKNFRIISVTGTDGKSTTSWILYNLLKAEYGDDRVYLSGNFDIPFSKTVTEILKKGQKRGYIIVEVSSFMAYILEHFAPDYSICTNFASDHLNWHKDLSEYFASKMHLFEQTKARSIIHRQVFDFARDHALVPPSLKNLRTYELRNASILSSSGKDWTDGSKIVISGRKKYELSETHFSGDHNALNILSAGIVMAEMGICSKRVKAYLKNIGGLPHRLELVGEISGILLVEDSKSTSSQSLAAALSSYGDDTQKNLLLIVGGSDKGDTFEHLLPRFEARVKAIACIGATKEHFVSLAKTANIPALSTDDIEEAVKWLYNQGKSGDVLMLSPGCASFGLFRDYLDRANQFRDALKKLR